MIQYIEEFMSARLDNYKKRNLRNRIGISKIKIKRKKYLNAIESKDENSGKLLQELDKTIQKAKSKGIIHKNKSKRLISRLAKKLIIKK